MPTREVLKAAMTVVAQGDAKKVARLVAEEPALLAAKDTKGETLLMVAAAKGRLSVVKTLLKKGASRRAVDTRGYTALHHAASAGHGDVVACLATKKGATVTTKAKDGSTPLMLAASTTDFFIVAALLQHTKGQGVNDRDAKGRTALFRACQKANHWSMRHLLLWGADHTIPDHNGTLPRRVLRGRNSVLAVRTHCQLPFTIAWLSKMCLGRLSACVCSGGRRSSGGPT